MEERDCSKAREEWIKKEEQAHEAVLTMLRKLDGSKPPPAVPPSASGNLSIITAPLKRDVNEKISGGERILMPDVRRRVVISSPGAEVLRVRRMGKFVEHLSSEEEMEEFENDIAEDKADWRLSRMGPKVLSYEPAPWEEEETTQSLSSPIEQETSHILEDIIEDEEDSESLSTQYVPTDTKSRILTPPAEHTHPSLPGSYFPIYKLPADIFPAPPSPRSPNAPIFPVSDFGIPKSPNKSSSNLRTRAGLKKIFLSTLRPKKRDDNEPLSPSTTISSSTTTTPIMLTPSIRITSPFDPRRSDGTPLGDDHPVMGKLSPVETGFKLPELRLSRADWGEWGRQVAERL